jgi:hypothetical protein
MAWRRIVLFCLLLVVIGAIASATVPRERRAPAEQPFPPAAAGPPADVVTARLPATKDIQAEVGDVLQVDVAHNAGDVVQVLTLGVSEPVEPGIDAQLVFDADRPGRFAVTLRDANKRIGTIEVKQPG